MIRGDGGSYFLGFISGIIGIFKFMVSSMGVIASSLMFSVANAQDGTDYKSTNYWHWIIYVL